MVGSSAVAVAVPAFADDSLAFVRGVSIGCGIPNLQDVTSTFLRAPPLFLPKCVDDPESGLPFQKRFLSINSCTGLIPFIQRRRASNLAIAWRLYLLEMEIGSVGA